ncbi:hypothetical protein ACFOZ7_01115 [Natribaculum luteum]|uniref:Uncharacterized protein n=1 Tax=Natribaculum luteum TaxID=1586232 RepID=A0ABD5NV11_9EURY|nr:hypothetical protein [Natribaculum luteum]
MIDTQGVEDRRLMGAAFSDFYPRYTVIVSMVISAIGGLPLGVASVLYFGPVDSLNPATLLQGLHSPVSVVAFSVGMGGWTQLVAWGTFGRNAPEDVVSEHPRVGLRSWYVAMMLVSVLTFTFYYYLITFLSSLVSILALAITAFFFLYRLTSSEVWVTIANTPRQNILITRLAFGVLLVAGIGAYVLGIAPTFTYEEWSVILLYGLIIWVGIVGGIDAAISSIEDALETQAVANRGTNHLTERYQKLCERAPDGVNIDVNIDDDLSTLQDAQGAVAEFETTAAWLDRYESYLDTRENLADHLDEPIHDRALSDSDELSTRVAMLSENLSPAHYDDEETAADAIDTLEVVVDTYNRDHLPDGFLTGDDADLLKTAGPSTGQLEWIESAARKRFA